MQLNSQQQLVKHKLSPTSSSPAVKRQKHRKSHHLLHITTSLEMTQQLMMSSGVNETIVLQVLIPRY